MDRRERQIRDRIAKQLIDQVNFTGSAENMITSALNATARYAWIYRSALITAGFSEVDSLTMTVSLQASLLTEVREAALEAYRIQQEGQ